jgi:hypothetical protein
MNLLHAIADITGGSILIWLCIRELRRILSEPPERPIDTWSKRMNRRGIDGRD